MTDHDLVLIDIVAEQQQKVAATAIFQLELIAKLALFIAITKPQADDILPLLDEISKQMLPIAVADFQKHGLDVKVMDLEDGRMKVMQMISLFLEFKLPSGEV